MIFLPIGDEPNSHTRVPWMNYALIGMNVAAYLLALSHGMGEGGYSAERYGEFVLRWAYDPADPAVATLFTSMFLHGGLAHLAGNMLFLWIFGDNVESRLGAFGYLVSYLCLGALSTLTFGYFNAGIELPLIGASGAISGVQGLYWVACPRHKVKIFVWLFIIIVTVIRVNARWIMVFWFFMQDALPILVGHGPAGDNVAHVAHLGGFVGGLGLMLLIRMFFPGMDRIEDEERGRAGQYKGGHAAARRYEHVRRRDPYGPRSGRTPPSARAASTPPPRSGSTPPPRSGSTPPPRSGSTPPPLPPPLPPPGHDES